MRVEASVVALVLVKVELLVDFVYSGYPYAHESVCNMRMAKIS